MFLLLVFAFIVPDVVESLILPGDELHGLVGRILKAMAKSKRTKCFIQDEREFFLANP